MNLNSLLRVLNSVHTTKSETESLEWLKGYKECLGLVHAFIRKNSDEYNLHVINRKLKSNISDLTSDIRILKQRNEKLKADNEKLMLMQGDGSNLEYKKALANSLIGEIKRQNYKEVERILNKWIK